MAVSTAEFHYEQFLQHVTVPAVSNKTTFGKDLYEFGKQLWGPRFHGVYMIDHIPHDINASKPYAILNLDAATDPGDGSHWIAVAHHRTGMWVYDSFGDLHEIPRELKAIYGSRTHVTDPDAEQGRKETNCGARALAWLLVMDMFGVREAKHI